MTLTTRPNPLSLLNVKLRTLRSPVFAVTLSALAMVASPTAQASDGKVYELSRAPKPKKPKSLVQFKGHEMSIDAAHELRATAGACTYAIMLNPGVDLCPDSQEVTTWTEQAEVEMSQFGGEILLSPGILSASASSAQQRDDCGSASAAAALNSTVNHVALATGSGLVAFSMIQGANSSEASDSDDVDFSTNCLTAAGSSTAHETLSHVITNIPFTLTADALVTAKIELSEMSGGSGDYDHVLGLTVSLGGTTCELETDGLDMPQTCTMVLQLDAGTYSLNSRVDLDAWTVSDSDFDPSSSVSYIDFVSATVAAQRL